VLILFPSTGHSDDMATRGEVSQPTWSSGIGLTQTPRQLRLILDGIQRGP
jgi:hypothetical protein